MKPAASFCWRFWDPGTLYRLVFFLLASIRTQLNDSLQLSIFQNYNRSRRINGNIFILQKDNIDITALHSLSALSFTPVIAESRLGFFLQGKNKENQSLSFRNSTCSPICETICCRHMLLPHLSINHPLSHTVRCYEDWYSRQSLTDIIHGVAAYFLAFWPLRDALWWTRESPPLSVYLSLVPVTRRMELSSEQFKT